MHTCKIITAEHILCATNTLSVQYSKFPTPDLAHGPWRWERSDDMRL